MDRCDPTRRVHRECFTTWPERDAYTRGELERLANQDGVAVVHRSDAVVAVLSDAVVLVRHVRALDLIIVPFEQWPDWLARREPIWSRSAHRDDLVWFATELAALPDAEQIRSFG
jgi:hypothetical protein